MAQNLAVKIIADHLVSGQMVIGEEIAIRISDDGRGLPHGFDVGQDSRLGLRIVQTLVEDGLHGHFDLRDDRGVSAIVRFPKSNREGEPWREPE